MSTYVGGRIVPTHAGDWDETAEYEPLTIVYYSSTGDSYISRTTVPAGTALDDEDYWALCSDYSVQLKNIESAVETLEAQVAANVSASTDSDADYAAEVVDARVDSTGTEYASLGTHIRAVEDELAGSHTMYLSDYLSSSSDKSGAAFSLDIDVDGGTYEGTVQVTSATIVGVTENRKYIIIYANDDPVELNSPDSTSTLTIQQMRIFGYDAATGTFNMFLTDEFQALGSNGYYIASWWRGMFYNAHIHPDVKITYNGTEYSAGELIDTYNTSYEESFVESIAESLIDSLVEPQLAGTHTMYLSSYGDAEIELVIDVDGGTYEGTIQVMSSTLIGVTENQQYFMISSTSDPIELNSPASLSAVGNMRVFGYDSTTKTLNLFSTAEFQALGSNGYYIASWWRQKFLNPHIDPDLTITYNGTEYSAGELFWTNTGSFVPQPYKDYVAEYVTEDADDEDGRGDIVSPSHWDCMEGRQFSMFFDCLSRHEDRKEMYRIQNSMSLFRNEYCLNYTPTSDDEDFDITIVRMNKSTMTVAESKAVTVKVHHPLTTSLTKNVCICGDSLVNNNYLAKEVWDMLDEDGDCVINHIGTRGGTGYEHEGRGSWTWALYLQGEEYNSMSNAFWDSDNECLNFQKYCEDNGYDGIDYFLIGLGTNDVGLGSTRAKTETEIQAIITRAKTFIDALLSEDYGYPDCKIGIGLPGPAAIYSSYASWSTAIFRNCINSLNLAYIEAFDDGAYNENVTCFAYGLRTDRMHAYPYTESAVNDRFEETCLTITEVTGSSSHPTQRGYQAWADGYYCQIRAWLEEDAE